MAKDADGARERWSQRKDGWMEVEERKHERAALDKLKWQIKKKAMPANVDSFFSRQV